MKNLKLLLFLSMVFFLCLVSSVNALLQVAGPLVITVPIGGSNSSRYGLINDGNETITVSLRAEGDVAPYLSFPGTVDLIPHKTVYTNITAKIPADYDKSLGGNLTGYVYALQEGKTGQVKINVQMKKLVNIIIPGLPSVAKEITTNIIMNSFQQGTQNPLSGLVVMFSSNSNSLILIILVLIILTMGIYIIKIRRR